MYNTNLISFLYINDFMKNTISGSKIKYFNRFFKKIINIKICVSINFIMNIMIHYKQTHENIYIIKIMLFVKKIYINMLFHQWQLLIHFRFELNQSLLNHNQKLTKYQKFQYIMAKQKL